MKFFFASALLALAFLGSGCRSPQTFDVVIRHGRIVDGSGKPEFVGDVAIKNGLIAKVGEVTGKTKQELDATGLVVAPGFIDVHTHADEVADMPLAENFLRMGVTTLVVGNCGASALDVGKFFRDIEAKKISPNVATFIGHNTVREKAMGGSFDRAPSPEELAKMKKLVDQAMRDGAIGLSTGLIYLPGVFPRRMKLWSWRRPLSLTTGFTRATCGTKTRGFSRRWTKCSGSRARRTCARRCRTSN